MDIWVFLGELSFFVLLFFLLVFSVYSLIEKEKRAFWRSAFFFVVLAVVKFAFYFFELRLRPWLFGTVFILSLIGLFLLLVPPLKKSSV